MDGCSYLLLACVQSRRRRSATRSCVGLLHLCPNTRQAACAARDVFLCAGSCCEQRVAACTSSRGSVWHVLPCWPARYRSSCCWHMYNCCGAGAATDRQPQSTACQHSARSPHPDAHIACQQPLLSMMACGAWVTAPHRLDSRPWRPWVPPLPCSQHTPRSRGPCPAAGAGARRVKLFSQGACCCARHGGMQALHLDLVAGIASPLSYTQFGLAPPPSGGWVGQLTLGVPLHITRACREFAVLCSPPCCNALVGVSGRALHGGHLLQPRMALCTRSPAAGPL